MIKTTEDLVDRIAEERAWRIKEISEMKNIVEVKSISSTRKSVVCRAGLALLYAHWEGFVKKSGTYFLEHVASQRLPLAMLQGNFVTIVLRSRIDQASNSKKYSAFEDVTNFIRNNQGTRASLPFKNIIQTQSNLSSSVLKEITWCLGIDYTIFATKEKLIDSRLVGRRNHVAHGEAIEINQEDFSDLANEVVGLIDIFRTQIENAAIMKRYKISL
jgi:hypothetical protein